ncbi:Proton pump-interactor [Trichinella pseudospiralis]
MPFLLLSAFLTFSRRPTCFLIITSNQSPASKREEVRESEKEFVLFFLWRPQYNKPRQQSKVDLSAACLPVVSWYSKAVAL